MAEYIKQQGIFVDFKNVMTSSRSKPPFGKHGESTERGEPAAPPAHLAHPAEAIAHTAPEHIAEYGKKPVNIKRELEDFGTKQIYLQRLHAMSILLKSSIMAVKNYAIMQARQ